MKRKIEILLLSLILTVVVTVGISSATKGLVIQPGDVNGDGAINAKDAVMLAQYLAGWDVVLGGDSHTVVIDPAVEPTCTQTGLTEGKHCSDCGMILVKQQVIPTKHEMEESFVQPTTSTQGYTLFKCKLCGYEEKSNFIPPVNSNGLAVEVNTTNMTCVITGIGDCPDTDINIPEKISGYTVVGIADKAFSEQTQIKSIKIPDTVETLGQRAFYDCTGLTEFTVPASVTSVGHQVFYKCDNLATVYYNSSFSPDRDKVFLNIPSIKTVVFGGTVVPNYICYNCANIESVKILDTVINFGTKYSSSYAFSGCTTLKEVIIGDSVTSIGGSAFEDCSSLASVEIPDSVTSIGGSAFWGCSRLTSVEIPDSVTSIGGSAFRGCSSLTSMEIPDSVTGIGSSAFYNCSSLTSVEIPDSVTSIDDWAFAYCSSLTSVVIPDSVTSIGDCAFQECSRLTSVEIPDSVTSICQQAFYDCSSLATVYYGGDAEYWATISIGSHNSSLTSATRYYYSATQPTATGNYWRYVDGKPTPW